MTGAPAEIRQTWGRSPVLVAAYSAASLVGLAGTWYFNLTYRGGSYLADWFANRASSSAAVDILVVFVVCTVFYTRETRRLGWPTWIGVAFTVLSLLLAVAFAFPLFLAVREARLDRSRRDLEHHRDRPPASTERGAGGLGEGGVVARTPPRRTTTVLEKVDPTSRRVGGGGRTRR